MTKEEKLIVDEVLALLPKSLTDLCLGRRYTGSDVDVEWERMKGVREKLEALIRTEDKKEKASP